MAKNIDNNWIDKRLKHALAITFKKSEKDITKEFLLTLKELDLSGKSLKKINGLEFATNLKDLDLSKNNIRDIHPLKHLTKLTKLELSENKIDDVSILNNLNKLQNIGLDCNNISSIPNLDNLKNLILINISNNKIKDLSFLSNLRSDNIKVIASEQCIFLNPVSVKYGDDYTLKPLVIWDKNKSVYYDNIQVTGKYEEIETDERPSMLYSISKIIVKNICSNCLIKADFYHEIPFLKSGILSGILVQPIIMKLTNTSFTIENLKKDKVTGSICGKLNLESSKNSLFKINCLKNKIITIIDSNGTKFSTLTNSNGEYKFSNLKQGRYTLLFPFLIGYQYKTQSLYIVNLKEGDNLNLDATIIKE
ncbi:hypothetical protein CHF27_010630 [Romboutsia maritimum]|uniref:Leucine-rich repeat domain-containing protein n=1 Tax=Romboutsia maritimum TaxID=2020948 RepID=A0A371IR44_9FIRM|nr:leucine-rich repeat domain-containing protein [Romboutsia maritimum]RDY22952.1 hypothetical protein CHF27_010630 [Romboutsia maritimum]